MDEKNGSATKPKTSEPVGKLSRMKTTFCKELLIPCGLPYLNRRVYKKNMLLVFLKD